MLIFRITATVLTVLSLSLSGHSAFASGGKGGASFSMPASPTKAPNASLSFKSPADRKAAIDQFPDTFLGNMVKSYLGYISKTVEKDNNFKDAIAGGLNNIKAEEAAIKDRDKQETYSMAREMVTEYAEEYLDDKISTSPKSKIDKSLIDKSLEIADAVQNAAAGKNISITTSDVISNTLESLTEKTKAAGSAFQDAGLAVTTVGEIVGAQSVVDAGKKTEMAGASASGLVDVGNAIVGKAISDIMEAIND